MTTTARSLVVLLVLTLTLTLPSNGMTTPPSPQSFSEDAEAPNLANAQLGGDPISSRVGHLSSDPYPLRADYIFLVTDPTDTSSPPENRRTYLEAWRPDGVQLFRVNTTVVNNNGQFPMQEIIDVVDLNGDGDAEIIGIFEGEAMREERPIIFVYNGDGSLQWNTEQFVIETGRLRRKMGLKAPRVRIYDAPGGTKRIVAVPNTNGDNTGTFTNNGVSDYANDSSASGYTNAESYVYFYDYNGGLPDISPTQPVPTPVPPNTNEPGRYASREMTSFPGIVVGDIDHSGDNEIVVVAKQRILVFDHNGAKVVYKQFVDPGVNFTTFPNSELDDPDGTMNNTYHAWQGRRYGVYKLTNIDTDSSLELVIAADENALPCCNSPGAVYQAFDFDNFSPGDGYIGASASRWQVHSATTKATSGELTPMDSGGNLIWPRGYKVGVPFMGIQDVNGDGYDDIVAGKITKMTPCSSCDRSTTDAGELDPTGIVIIETKVGVTNRVHDTGAAGIALDVLRWTPNQARPDIVAWNNATKQHVVYEVSTSFGLTPSLTTFANGDNQLLQRDFSQDATLPQNVGTNSPIHSFLKTAAAYTSHGPTTTVVEQPRSCLGGGQNLQGWTYAGATLTQTLSVTSAPGRVTNILCANDRSSSVWIFEVGTTCASDTNRMSTYIQPRSNQPNSDLIAYPGTGDGSDTIGVYTSNGGGWFLRNENSPGNADTVFTFGPGGAGILPLSGDWNADGEDTAGIYVSSTGTFFLRNSNTSGNADVAVSFGAGGADYLPIVGDWDRDGDDTIGVYHKPSGAFFLKNSNTPGPADITIVFGGGGPNILPVVGDWDGDGQYTIGIYAISSGAFFLRNSNTSGNADVILTFGPGGAGITPIVGDWDGDGDHTVGIYATASGAFFLKNSNTTGNADLIFTYGPPNATPVVGNWDGRC